MNYLFLYMYLRARTAGASTNWTNWTNPRRASRLFQLFQFVLWFDVCVRVPVAARLAASRGAGPSWPTLIRGRNEREIAPVSGAGNCQPMGCQPCQLDRSCL